MERTRSIGGGGETPGPKAGPIPGAPSAARESTDGTSEQVLQALQDPRWDFRTVGGIARQTGLPEDCVLEVLVGNPALVRESDAVDTSGQRLFTPRSRKVGLRERLAAARTIVAKRVR